MEEEDDDDNADDDGLFQQIALKRFNRGINQAGTVISRHDDDTCGKRGCDLTELLFDSVNDVQGIQTLAHDDDSADSFALAVPLGDSFADVGPKTHGSKIAQENWSSVLAADRNCCEIIQRPQIAEAANHILCATQVEHSAAHLIGAGLHSVDDRREGDTIGKQLVRIELHLVLADEAADARNFRDSRHSFESIPQTPVLQTAQLSKAMLPTFIYDGIFVDPPCSSSIGTNRRMDVL